MFFFLNVYEECSLLEVSIIARAFVWSVLFIFYLCLIHAKQR